MGDYRDRRDRDRYSDRDRDRDRYNDSRPPLPTKSMMGSRLYVGKLPSDIRERDIDKVFGKFGRIREIAMKGNYCFIVRVVLILKEIQSSFFFQ